jgi:SAM-dependent methyltransferase
MAIVRTALNKLVRAISIPSRLRRAERRIAELESVVKRLQRQLPAAPLVPPEHLYKVVGCPTHDHFVKTGLEAFRILRDHGGLKRTDRVLDVGCGCGRVAVPLTRYLTSGSYHGFDVAAELVRWAREHITPRHPNFHFRHVDVYNDFYNPGGRCKPSKFEFPYAPQTFDYAFLNSVFTHMLYEDAVHYLNELARTLKPGGTALISFFMLDAESARRLESAPPELNFRHDHDHGLRIQDLAKPAAAVAYPEETVRSLLLRSGFELREPILYGGWCGRTPAVSFQDYVVVRRLPTARLAGYRKLPEKVINFFETTIRRKRVFAS